MLQIICPFTQLHVVSAHFLYILSLIIKQLQFFVTPLIHVFITAHTFYMLFFFLTFAVFCYKIKAFHCFEYKNVAIHTNI